MAEPCWCVKDINTIADLKMHYIKDGCERARRILRLNVTRSMTFRSASTVIDAILYGIGCIEGEVPRKD
jgi:hypothetical protein